MARYSTSHKSETREKILDAATRLFKTKGFSTTGVDIVMAKIGLTAGGFYAHFKSKESLLIEMLRDAVPNSIHRLWEGLDNADHKTWLENVVKRYLSRTHRDSEEIGCAIPALLSELGRGSEDIKQEFENGFLKLLERFELRIDEPDAQKRQDMALATLALCVGGISLSRSVSDKQLSDRILKACRHTAYKGLGL